MVNPSDLKIGIALFALSNFTRNSTIEAGLYIIDKYNMTAVEIHHIGNRLGKGRGVKQYPSSQRAQAIGTMLKGVDVSLHAPYEMTLTVKGKTQVRTTKTHFTMNFKLGDLLGATHLTFHPGSLHKQTSIKDMKKLFRSILQTRDERGYQVVPAPEVAGKIKGFGGFFQVAKFASELGVPFCWDFSHDYARGGDIETEKGILKRLEFIDDHFNLKKIKLPIHISGIKTNRWGEVKHTSLLKGDKLPWKLFLSVLKEQNYFDKVSIICESKSEKRVHPTKHPSLNDMVLLRRFITSKVIDKQYTPRPKLTSYLSYQNPIADKK